MSVTVTSPENLVISIENSNQQIGVTVDDGFVDTSLTINGGENFNFLIQPPEFISVELTNSQGPSGPAGEQVYVQSSQPEFKEGVPAFWIQTGMNAGQDFTFWFFDGTMDSPIN